MIQLNLGLFGVWPTENNNFITKYIALFHAFNVFIIICLPRLIAFLFFYWGQVDVMIQSLSTNLPFIISVIKLYIFYSQQKGFDNKKKIEQLYFK